MVKGKSSWFQQNLNSPDFQPNTVHINSAALIPVRHILKQVWIALQLNGAIVWNYKIVFADVSLK